MRRIFALAALVALTLGIMAPSLVSAQTGTPAAGSTGAFGIPLGTAVPWVGSDGAPVGTITVTNITDPFQGYESSSAPQRGYHYATADVTVTNTSGSPIQFDPSTLQAFDSDGFVAAHPSIIYAMNPPVTAIQFTDALAPGASVSGVVPFLLFGDTTIQRMAYSPTYSRLISVLDLRTEPAVVGTPVSIMGTEGSEIAQVTVNSVSDSFSGYDSSSAPPRGSTYAAIEATVTNTGTGVLNVSSSDFWVIDADGFVLSSAYVTRTDTTVPDFEDLDLNPGESQSGILIYEIYEGVPIETIAFGDGYTSLNVVADVSESSSTSAPVATAPPVSTVVATTAAISEATVAADTTSSPDCAGLVEWGLDLVDRISAAAELTAPFQTADASTLDPATVRDVATQLRAMGDEQAASNPPAAATELNTIMTEQFYYALADAVDQIAGALEQNNAAAALAGQLAAQEVSKVFDEGGPYDLATQALTTACPNEVQQLDAQAGS